jgi:hypothetical protein
MVYVTTRLEQALRPRGTEALEPRWVSLDEALAMIDSGEIHDALTQIGRFASDWTV